MMNDMQDAAPILHAKQVGYGPEPIALYEAPRRRPSWTQKIVVLGSIAVLVYAWTGVLLTWIGSLGTGDFFTLVGSLGARF